LATTAAVYALSFSATGVRRALEGDMDSIADIIFHLAEILLPVLKTNERLKNRHGRLARQHRKLENKNRSSRDAHGKQRLGDPDGESFVVHVHSPLI
jgi:hypothetical protein